jgi:hypothetical protein
MRWSFLLNLGLLLLLSVQQPMGMGGRLCLPCGQFSPSGAHSEEEAELLTHVARPGVCWSLQARSVGTSRQYARSPRPLLRMRCPFVASRDVGARWRAALLPRRQPPEDEQLQA